MEIQRKNEFTWPAHMLTCSPHVFLHVLMLKGIGLLTVTWPCKNQEGWPVWCPCWNVVFFFLGSSCLFFLNSLGKLLALSLPNLSPLLDVECSFLMKDYRLGLRSCAICFKSRVLSYSKLWLKSVGFLYVVCCNSSQLPVVSRLKHVCKEL